jgi:hypothetical protein
LILLLIATSSSSCQKERESETPADSPQELPEKAVVAEVSIASVSLVEDCPDPAPKAAADDKNVDQGARAAEMEVADLESSDSDDARSGYGMPCSQSTMQIAITGQGEASSKLSIVAIRLLGPKGEQLGTMQSRLPTIWKAEGYSAWDEMIMPKTDVKASYKLSAPNWGEVQKKLGGSSYGPLFRVEADIKIDGVTKTLRSSEIVREQIEMIDT